MEVFGSNFLPAYTEGDNSNVVATDTMKNFILTQALAFEGATLEAFLYFLGQQFLATYPQMEISAVDGMGTTVCGGRRALDPGRRVRDKPRAL